MSGALAPRLFHEDGDPYVAGVDAQRGRQLEHFHDLLTGGALLQRVADVLAYARDEQVGRRRVHCDVDELLLLGRQGPALQGVPPKRT